MTKRIGLAIAMAVVAATSIAAPASARWYGDGRWHEDDRRWDNRYYGYHYQAPPVIYGTPYNYGYVAPPVVYGAEPGINFNIRIP
jgi:hypothetical protein